jgi:Predicted membrane protein (DUF2306)
LIPPNPIAVELKREAIPKKISINGGILEPLARPGLGRSSAGQTEMSETGMQHQSFLAQVLKIAAAVLIVKVTLSVVSNYHNYAPPNFTSDFLRGREGYFFGRYQCAFYTHIVSGPSSLFLGIFLISERFRKRFPRWHRYLGRVQVACVLLLVTPSGLAMAYRAAAGPVAAMSLATLAVATAVCVSLGTWSALKRRFADHHRWMWRCYLLLCSAVVLRVIGGLATVTGMTYSWIDPVATWASWVVPLAVFEVREWIRRTPHSIEQSQPRARNSKRQREIAIH